MLIKASRLNFKRIPWGNKAELRIKQIKALELRFQILTILLLLFITAAVPAANSSNPNMSIPHSERVGIGALSDVRQ